MQVQLILRHPPYKTISKIKTQKNCYHGNVTKKNRNPWHEKKDSSPTSPVIEIERVQTLGALVLF